MSEFSLQKILDEGTWISSSGTTGEAKRIFRSPQNISTCNKVSAQAQNITPTSSIYTVTRMTHAGGLLAQSLPAFELGAQVEIQKFNPYTFLDKFKRHSHTFLPPDHMLAISKTKNFKNYNFNKKYILTGSSPVSLDIIEKYVERNAIVQPNWGMSEVGPITIHLTIEDLDLIDKLKKITPPNASIMGNHFEIEYKILDNELWIRGPLCVYEDWFATGDLVEICDGFMFYRGRKTL